MIICNIFRDFIKFLYWNIFSLLKIPKAIAEKRTLSKDKLCVFAVAAAEYLYIECPY